MAYRKYAVVLAARSRGMHWRVNAIGLPGRAAECHVQAGETTAVVEIHLFGKLRRHAPGFKPGGRAVIQMPVEPHDTIATVLARADIDTDRVYSLFFNFRLLAARSRMAYWLRYHQAPTDPLDWDLDVTVHDGDRIALFGRDMAALVV